MIYAYLIFCLITAVINLTIYYYTKLRPLWKTATIFQKIGAIGITFLVSFITAPVLVIDLIIFLNKNKGGIHT